MFTPSLFLACAVTLGLFHIIALNRLMGFAITFILLIYYGTFCGLRMPNWNNDGTLYAYSAELEDGNPLSAYAAGQFFEKTGDLNKKSYYFQKTVNLLKLNNSQNLFDERTYDAFATTATEIGYSILGESPKTALELSELATHQFLELRKFHDNRIDSNESVPYFVKTKALLLLNRPNEAKEACNLGLTLSEHPGLRALCNH